MAARLMIDAWVSDAFGLAVDDVRYIGEQFPIYDKDVPAEHRYPLLATSVFEAFRASGPDAAERRAADLTAGRAAAGLGFGLDDLWQPRGGWEQANAEARAILAAGAAA